MSIGLFRETQRNGHRIDESVQMSVNYLAFLLSLAFDRFSFGHLLSRSHSNSRLHLIGNHADMPRSVISPMARSSSLGWYAHFQNKTTNKSMIRASPFCVELETSWSLQPGIEKNALYSLSLSPAPIPPTTPIRIPCKFLPPFNAYYWMFTQMIKAVMFK